MKIIDLLKLIQEGKQPKRVIYKGKKYRWCKNMGDYRRDGCYECLLMTKIFEYDDHMHNSLYNMIYDEVEIIEEKPKKIEKLDNRYYDEVNQCFGGKKELGESVLVDKINEVIDKLNYLAEKSDKDE